MYADQHCIALPVAVTSAGLENRRKRKPNKIPDCLIPYLLLVLTRQREILVTALILVALSHRPLRLLQHIYAGRCLGFIIDQVSVIK